MPRGLIVTNEKDGVTLHGTPTQIGDQFAFTLHSRDQLGNTVDQTYTMTVLPVPGTAT
jgi:hypothetical protein